MARPPGSGALAAPFGSARFARHGECVAFALGWPTPRGGAVPRCAPAPDKPGGLRLRGAGSDERTGGWRGEREGGGGISEADEPARCLTPLLRPKPTRMLEEHVANPSAWSWSFVGDVPAQVELGFLIRPQEGSMVHQLFTFACGLPLQPRSWASHLLASLGVLLVGFVALSCCWTIPSPDGLHQSLHFALAFAAPALGRVPRLRTPSACPRLSRRLHRYVGSSEGTLPFRVRARSVVG